MEYDAEDNAKDPKGMYQAVFVIAMLLVVAATMASYEDESMSQITTMAGKAMDLP